MNPKIEFFSMIPEYAGRGWYGDQATLEKIITQFEKLWSDDSDPRCKFKGKFELRKLLPVIQHFNTPDSVQGDSVSETAVEGIELIIWWMFKELSVMKNPIAMTVFHGAAKKLSSEYKEGNHLLVFAKSAKHRIDGSGTMVLHVSDIGRFVALLNGACLSDGIPLNDSQTIALRRRISIND